MECRFFFIDLYTYTVVIGTLHGAIFFWGGGEIDNIPDPSRQDSFLLKLLFYMYMYQPWKARASILFSPVLNATTRLKTSVNCAKALASMLASGWFISSMFQTLSYRMSQSARSAGNRLTDPGLHDNVPSSSMQGHKERHGAMTQKNRTKPMNMLPLTAECHRLMPEQKRLYFICNFDKVRIILKDKVFFHTELPHRRPQKDVYLSNKWAIWIVKAI